MRKRYFIVTMLFLFVMNISSFTQQNFMQKKAFVKGNLQPSFSAEYKSALFTERFNYTDFSSSVWKVNDAGASGWLIDNSNEAGGEAPQLIFIWGTNDGGSTIVGVSRCISPEINTTGLSSLLMQAKFFIDDYDGGAGEDKIRIETSSDKGATWKVVYEFATIDEDYGEDLAFVIDNDDVGADNFQIALVFEGDSYNIDFIYWDDIIISETVDVDFKAVKTNFPVFDQVGEEYIPTVTVKSYGVTDSEATVNVVINDGNSDVYNQTILETIGALGSEEIELPSYTFAETGTYTIIATATAAGDADNTNDTFSSEIQIIEQVYPKKPLYEEFTSSTCAPCASYNPILDGILENHTGEYSLIKHQANWPGSGDPYYISSCGVRITYYGVSGVPTLISNGVEGYLETNAQFVQIASAISPFKIEIDSAAVNGTDVYVKATLTPGANWVEGLKLHIAIVEKVTKRNARTNGEKEFYNVLMSSLGNGSGLLLGALTSGIPESFTNTFNMSVTKVEELSDLAVVVFVQDDANKAVLQSEMEDVMYVVGVEEFFESTFQVYPSPSKGTIQFTNIQNAEVKIYNLTGQLLKSFPNVQANQELNLNDLGSGSYIVHVFQGNEIGIKKMVINK